MGDLKATLRDDGDLSKNGHKKKLSEQISIDTKSFKKSQASSTIKGGRSSETLTSPNKHTHGINSETDLPETTNFILEPSMKHQPYFYYQNSTNSYPYFSLHSRPPSHHDASTLYTTYGTTLTIIAFLHLVYFYQWNTRRSRQEVCTSYDQLVNKKQFYRVVMAVVSHPPVDGGERDANNFGNTANSSHLGLMGGGDSQGSDGPIERTSFFWRCISCNLFQRLSPILQRICPLYHQFYQQFLYPLMYGSLSGLPLLTYATHIIWQCRALEELYDDHDGKLILGVVDNNLNLTQFTGIGTAATKMQTAGGAHTVNENLLSADEGYTYFRVLVALAVTSILFELSLLRSILRRLDWHLNWEGYRTTPAQLLSQRAMCSIAALTTALLEVYDSNFPNAPPPALPFVRTSFISSLGLSVIFSILLLTLLVHRIHPVTSVMSGLLSGSLWSLGVTSFLGTRYWGNAMIFSFALAMTLSLKAEPSYSKFLTITLPCLDYVAWNREGEISGGSAPNNPNDAFRWNSTRERLSRNNSRNEDLEMGSHFQTQNGGEQNRSPLLSSQSTSMSGGSSIAIRGRVPLINTMDSDLDGAADLVVGNNEDTVPAASSRFVASLSRRAGGSGINET